MKDKLSKWIKKNKPISIAIISLSIMLVLIGGIGIANSLNSKEVAKETIEETKKEVAKESKKETAKESKKETKKEEPKVSKKVEEKVNKELDKEVEKIKAKNLSKEEEQKEIEKATEKVIEKVAKEEKIDKTILTSSIKETVKETQKETKKEVATSKPSTQNKPSTNTNTVSKPKEENKVTKPSPSKPSETKKETVKETQKEQPKNQIVVKRETKRDIISYGTQRAYYIDGAKTRVKRQGQNGYKDTFYDVEYTNGKETNRTVVDTKYQAPVDEIIETYVKVQDEVWEEREVDDLDNPIYNYYNKDRWFVRNQDTGEVTYFYSAIEAQDYYGELTAQAIGSNWGTAPMERVYTDEIIGYYPKIENVKVQDEIWEWR